MAWAWEQDLPVAEKLLLMGLADNAGRDGVWLFAPQKQMAHDTGMSERTVRRHLQTLEEKTLIARRAQYEMGNRVADRIELAVSLPAKLAGDDLPANGDAIPAILSAGQNDRALSSSSEGSTANDEGLKKKEAPGQIGRWSGVPDEMRADAEQLLRDKHKVGGRIVTPVEMEIAACALAEFNRQAGSDYGVGAHLRSIVMRIRERPSATAEHHVRLVQSAWRIKWWARNGNGRKPTPAVVYGERCFENVWQDASDEARGELQQRELSLKERRYSGGRSWDELTANEQAAAKENASMGIMPEDHRRGGAPPPPPPPEPSEPWNPEPLTVENF